jgi:hypothetical protein
MTETIDDERLKRIANGAVAILYALEDGIVFDESRFSPVEKSRLDFARALFDSKRRKPKERRTLGPIDAVAQRVLDSVGGPGRQAAAKKRRATFRMIRGGR